ncbi:arsenite efflux transporter metallochaperone ArsD [Alkalibacterium sp. 20]|uniref:arsenite efflux transporter metallochaperone ArsD n=1 Tax=Alkalibacterium sp. 20 TaxID=1798803 RepID=UPI0009002271|nr:arsenite efflux transporter metallochaperone ArsD [Alkalibacterium sp. 20]OJF90306.1 hypothetical protein AX762_04270 [Alkalibacterium sp. 20]
MIKLEIFEPALCCSTGVCGPSANDDLMMITSLVTTVNTIDGYEAVRYNLSGDTQAFVNNENVTAILQEKQSEALPITLVNGEVKKTGEYPTLEEISDYMEVKFVMAGSSDKECCGGSNEDCCGGSDSGCC